jgi:hypothetical protein
MRLLGLLAAPLVLAGCSGGGHATPPVHGVYEARVTVGGNAHLVWLDVSGNRFRVTGRSGRRTLTVSDGHSALTTLYGFTTRASGSPAFLLATADPAVGALRDRLIGRSVPANAAVTGLHRVSAPGPELFSVADTPPNEVIRQVRLGVAPQTGPPAYWLGQSFHGKAPAYASLSTGKTVATYTVDYPGIEIQVSSSQIQLPSCSGTIIALADGTPARLAVAPADLGPCPGTSAAIDSFLSGTTETPGGFAVVGTSIGTVTISGPAVSADTAASIARALRPV